jgi:hypothetical protein
MHEYVCGQHALFGYVRAFGRPDRATRILWLDATPGAQLATRWLTMSSSGVETSTTYDHQRSELDRPFHSPRLMSSRTAMRAVTRSDVAPKLWHVFGTADR